MSLSLKQIEFAAKLFDGQCSIRSAILWIAFTTPREVGKKNETIAVARFRQKKLHDDEPMVLLNKFNSIFNRKYWAKLPRRSKKQPPTDEQICKFIGKLFQNQKGGGSEYAKPKLRKNKPVIKTTTPSLPTPPLPTSRKSVVGPPVLAQQTVVKKPSNYEQLTSNCLIDLAIKIPSGLLDDWQNRFVASLDVKWRGSMLSSKQRAKLVGIVGDHC